MFFSHYHSKKSLSRQSSRRLFPYRKIFPGIEKRQKGLPKNSRSPKSLSCASDLLFRSRHCHLEILLILKDLVGIRIPLLLPGTHKNDRKDCHIDHDREHRDDPLCSGISHGRHRLAESRCSPGFSIYRRNGRKPAAVLEQRKYLSKHTPQCQRVGTVLDPTAFIPERIGHRRCQQQGKAA